MRTPPHMPQKFKEYFLSCTSIALFYITLISGYFTFMTYYFLQNTDTYSVCVKRRVWSHAPTHLWCYTCDDSHTQTI